MSDWTYENLSTAVRGYLLPLVIVDVDRFDRNVQYFVDHVRAGRKKLRIASKSLRVPELLRRALALAADNAAGLMCYSALEATFLSQQGFDELLVAYPSVQEFEVREVAKAVAAGATIELTVDCEQHLSQLAKLWDTAACRKPLGVCLDIDVSWRKGGQHIGAQRSPARKHVDVYCLLERIKQLPQLELRGVMTYESQLAGVTDSDPRTPGRNMLMRIMKHFSRHDVQNKRLRIAELLREKGITLKYFNGGGTGSFLDAVADVSLTEVTVGSGLLQSRLFDYYRGVERPPALCFALPVTRCPQKDRVTCQSGGYIASGPPGPDRLPVPILIPGLRSEPREEFGEVQSPFVVPPEFQGRLRIGSPLFFRPAKSGEIAERFAKYCILEHGTITHEVPTYRGLGQCFP